MPDLTNIPLKTITGQASSLSDYAGKVLLIVNVASQCGLTPQYEKLEKLYQDYRDRGLVVLGFPSNDFAGQEPGSDEEIAAFCSASYSVDFPLFQKGPVSGPEKQPLYTALTSALSLGDAGAQFRDGLKSHGLVPNEDPEVLWNFEKFLISKEGKVSARFSPSAAPDSPAVLAKIEEELAK